MCLKLYFGGHKIFRTNHKLLAVITVFLSVSFIFCM